MHDSENSRTAASQLPQSGGWRQLCDQMRISPDEVRLVFDRYDAYRRFRQNPSDHSLEQWFRFYHMEKRSDGQQQAGPSPSGCSVDSDAVNNACIERPGDFLVVLKAYVAESGQ